MSSDFTGIALRIGATLFFTIMVLFIKFVADDIATGQIVFFRSAFALIPLVLFLYWTKDFPSGLKTSRPFGHVARCLLGCFAMFASFASLKYLPIAHATVIGYIAPILAVILARLILKEEVTGARWLGIFLGFSGMLVLILPRISGVEADQDYFIGASLGVLMAIFTSGAKIQIRSLAKTENAGAIAFYFALTCTIAGLATLPFGWSLPDAEQLFWLIGCGFAGGIAHIMMTLSYQYSEVSKLATFEYLSLLFAVLSDLIFFAIIPDANFYLSSVLIIAATLIVAFSDRIASLLSPKTKRSTG
ncbi:MAG: DMT family transporter [Cohaesibacter sp.]|jgi:drug/metabolite transporter (DMT)-like permease|nr:DMT family transporter [Cohaesibacter sp.]